MTRHASLHRQSAGWRHALGALLALTLITAPAWSATATRTSKYEYDVSGRLVKEVVEPTSSDLCLVTTYSYTRNNPLRMLDPSGFADGDATPAAGSLASMVEHTVTAAKTIFAYWKSAALDSRNPTATQPDAEASKGSPITAGAVAMAAGREVKSFIDGGYGEKVSGAAANGDYESAVGYTVAGALFGTMNVLSFGEAGAITNSARAIGSKLVAGQGGRFANLVGTVGDDLTAHHIPQAALKFTSRADGGAVVMTTAEHEATRTFRPRRMPWREEHRKAVCVNSACTV